MNIGKFVLAAVTLAAALSCKTIDVYVCDPSLENEVKTWQEMLSRHETAVPGTTPMGYTKIVSGKKIPPVKLCGKESAADLVLAIDSTLAVEEYVVADGRLTGGSGAAVFLGLQDVTVDLVSGVDLRDISSSARPKYAHRGALLDCCRHFWTVDEVKEFIDILALNKMNVFHWHLSEDQGWRVEIKKYPRLTEVGSIRSHTDEVAYNSFRDASRDSLQYGPYFYTQDQVREIVAYAADRHIKVVPEIDMPGHMLAALASYPHLGCVGEGYEVWTHWGISPDVICLGKDSSYEFLLDVIDEILDLFPGDLIHIGGDEAPSVRWKECPECQAFMKEHGMQDVGELQKYMTKIVGDRIRAAGRSCIVWDDAIDRGLDTDAVVMNWSCREGRIEAVRANGNRIIQTPKYHCYLDYYQTYEPQKTGEADLGSKRYIPLQKCLEFNPIEGFTEEEAERVIGIQGNVWTETMPSFDQVEFMILPRLSALAEVGLGSGISYDDFVVKLKEKLVPAYEYFGFVHSRFVIDGVEPVKASDEFKAKYEK